MDDPNAMKVIRLNQIIQSAQKCIQHGDPMREVWFALYVPPDLLMPEPPQVEKS